MIKRSLFSEFVNMVSGICVEILATLAMMAVVFAIGFFILGWLGK